MCGPDGIVGEATTRCSVRLDVFIARAEEDDTG
jgi:hypothetical protein